MSRPKSAVLSAADQKAVVANLKSKIKSTAAEIKSVVASRVAADKANSAAIKAADKVYVGVLKTTDKVLKALYKDEASLQAQLVAMTPPKTAPASIDTAPSVMRKPRSTKAAAAQASA